MRKTFDWSQEMQNANHSVAQMGNQGRSQVLGLGGGLLAQTGEGGLPWLWRSYRVAGVIVGLI